MLRMGGDWDKMGRGERVGGIVGYRSVTADQTISPPRTDKVDGNHSPQYT
jgi:hypothetical protein